MLAAAERLDIPATAVEGAEELGLIEIADGRIRFRHPLVRSAIYQSAAAPLRRRAHRALAACLTGEWQADRRAWHRAAAVASADEDVAAELAAMAERTRARSGYAVAARALERAAQLTPAPERRVGRAIAAADAYWRAGRGTRARTTPERRPRGGARPDAPRRRRAPPRKRDALPRRPGSGARHSGDRARCAWSSRTLDALPT